jgi:non-ribosomal peptide synthase protein (TIGR01720 family)
VETERAMARALDADATRRLLQEATVRQRATLEVLLVAALARNLGRCFGMDRLRLAMEGHGREEIAADLDLSRSVGWFTAMYPLCLDLPDDRSLGAVIARVKEQLGAVPERGIGYGLLRYLSSASVQRELAAQDVPEVSFNYTGQFDSVLGRGVLLAAAPEPVQGARGKQDERPHLLDVAASVVGGCLRVIILYSEARHSEQTVAELMDAIQADLQSLTETTSRMDYESRDFPNANLSKRELNQLIGKIQRRGQQ